jgi:hypothetical protein
MSASFWKDEVTHSLTQAVLLSYDTLYCELFPLDLLSISIFSWKSLSRTSILLKVFIHHRRASNCWTNSSLWDRSSKLTIQIWSPPILCLFTTEEVLTFWLLAPHSAVHQVAFLTVTCWHSAAAIGSSLRDPSSLWAVFASHVFVDIRIKSAVNSILVGWKVKLVGMLEIYLY